MLERVGDLAQNPAAIPVDDDAFARQAAELQGLLPPAQADQPSLVALNLEPGDLIETLRDVFAGWAWAGSRMIGGYAVTLAIISPKRPEEVFQGDDLASSFGNLAVNAADAVIPNLVDGTYFMSIRPPGATKAVIVTYNRGTGRLEIGSNVESALLLPTPGAPAALGFVNARAGLDTDGDAANPTVSFNSGLLLRAPPVEMAFQRISNALLNLALSQTIAAGATAATGAGASVAVLQGLVAAAAAAGGLILKDWKVFLGPVVRADMTFNQDDLANSTININGQTISFNDVYTATDSFVDQAGAPLVNALDNLLLPAPTYSIDDILVTRRALDDGTSLNPKAIISFKSSQALNAGADAFAMLDTAWSVWDSDDLGSNMRQNGASLYHSFDPRMAIGRAFMASIFSDGYGSVENVRFAGSDQATLDAYIQRDDLQFIGRHSFGDLRVDNISHILDVARIYWTPEEFNARLDTFAREVTRLGYNVNFGSQDLAAALFRARQSLPQAGPAENADAIQQYFGRPDLQNTSTTFLASAPGADSAIRDVTATFWTAVDGAGKDGMGAFRTALANAKDAGVSRASLVAAIAAEVFPKRVPMPNEAMVGTPANDGFAKRITIAPALDSQVMSQIKVVLKGTELGDALANVPTTGPDEFVGLTAEAFASTASLIAVYNADQTKLSELKSVAEPPEGKSLLWGMANVRNDVPPAQKTQSDNFLNLFNSFIETNLGERSELILAAADYDATRKLFASSLQAPIDSQTVLDRVGSHFDKLPDGYKTRFTSDWSSYEALRAAMSKPAATEVQRKAFRDAYMVAYSTGSSLAAANSAGNTAAERLDTPLRMLPGALTSLARSTDTSQPVLIGELMPAFTALGEPSFTLSGPDANNFMVSDGKLYVKAGVELTSIQGTSANLTVKVTYPEAGPQPTTWRDAWPPEGTVEISLALSTMIYLPVTDNAPNSGATPEGWERPGFVPEFKDNFLSSYLPQDGVIGPGPFPVRMTGVSGPSPVGGTVQGYLVPLLEGGYFNMKTKIEGLEVGKTYTLSPIWWQLAVIETDYTEQFWGADKGAGSLVAQLSWEPGATGPSIKEAELAASDARLATLKASLDEQNKLLSSEFDALSTYTTNEEFEEADGRISLLIERTTSLRNSISTEEKLNLDLRNEVSKPNLGTETFNFEPEYSPMTDDWKKAVITFTAQASSVELTLGLEQIGPRHPMLLVDIGDPNVVRP
jgi:hypothetical protein